MSSITIQEFLQGSVMVLLSVLCSGILGVYCAKRFEGDRNRTAAAFAVITLLISSALTAFYGVTAQALRGITLCIILEYCSYSDIKTRMCADFPHVMIAIAAVCSSEPGELPKMLLGAALVFLIQLLGAWAMKAEINGADLKLSTACAFMLGTFRGILGLVIGMILGITVNLIKSRDRKTGFPLIPYLAAGFTAAYFL